MTKRYFATGSFAALLAASTIAGQRPVVIPPTVTPQERLENAVRQDQAMIESAGTENKILAAEARRETGRRKLAEDQAALEAFKTAGPAAFERSRLENEIAAARFESKLLSQRARIETAEKKLAALQ